MPEILGYVHHISADWPVLDSSCPADEARIQSKRARKKDLIWASLA